MTDENHTYEINIVENGEVDPHTEKFRELFRVPIAMKRINYGFEPTQCGPAARMKATQMAKGKYIIFVDAHTEVGKNTVPKLISHLEEDRADAVHGTTLKTHYVPMGGAHYKLFGNKGPNLNTHFHGSYCRALSPDKPYPVVNATLAYVAYRRQEFLDLRGYHPECRFYPHPEGYLPLKYLMFDKRVILDPRCFHFHSNYPRNYNSKTKEEGLTIDIKGDPYKLVGQDNQIRNALICGYTLGGEKWLNLMRDSWLERVASRYVVNGIVEDARRVAEEERKWLEANAKYTLDEVLINARRNKIPGLEVWEPRISEDPLK